MNKVILELNEINIDLLKEASLTRPSIMKILENGYGSFAIPDTYDSDFLEPWSQWVTAHTGVASKEHHVKHLGDVKNLNYPEIWDINPDLFGVVWGCLNSKTPNSKKIIYFPDPWTITSKPTRWYLYPIINFLKYAVSKRSESSKLQAIANLVFVLPSLFYTFVVILLFMDLKLIKSIAKYNRRIFNSSMIYAIVEYLLFKMATFLGSKENKIDIMFINMVAHAQHYYWNTDLHYVVDFCLDRVDDILSICHKKYSMVFAYNGLSQEYSGNKEQWHSWIPIGGWSHFVRNVLKINCKVAPCMSYDCNLYFDDEKDVPLALENLAKFWVSNQQDKLFLIELNPLDGRNIFIRLSYYGLGTEKTNLCNASTKISDFFELAAIRTGRHEQYSVLIGPNAKKYDRSLNTNTQVIDVYKTIAEGF
jgi:hypothetical protein